MSLLSLVRRYGLTAIIVYLCLFTIAIAAAYKLTENRVAGVSLEKPVVFSPAPTITPSPVPFPTVAPSKKPIYITAKASVAPLPQPSTVPMVNCGLNNNTIYVTMSKQECDKKQAEENDRIRNSTSNTTYVSPFRPFPSIAPLPSIAPYQPSQEYQNALNQAMQNINASYAPSQFVPPSPQSSPALNGCFGAPGSNC